MLQSGGQNQQWRNKWADWLHFPCRLGFTTLQTAGGGATTTGPDATHPPTIFQNLGGGVVVGGVQQGVGGGVFLPGVGGGVFLLGVGGGPGRGSGRRLARGEGGGG